MAGRIPAKNGVPVHPPLRPFRPVSYTHLYRKALNYRESMITKVDTWEEFKQVLDDKGGFLLAHWDGTVETEVAIKEATKATIR